MKTGVWLRERERRERREREKERERKREREGAVVLHFALSRIFL
jgi:hypothetical protein